VDKRVEAEAIMRPMIPHRGVRFLTLDARWFDV
jgi:hypothetical protein